MSKSNKWYLKESIQTNDNDKIIVAQKIKMRTETEMYLRYINYQNVGAIRNLNIPFAFSEDGNPKPIIFVGENGSGKSILLSNIVDAFYEFANKIYTNASVKDGLSTEYYKIISSQQISLNEKYMVAYLQFIDKENCLEYIFKSGIKSWDAYNNEQHGNLVPAAALKWTDDISNHKVVSFQGKNINAGCKQDVDQIFLNNVICYFPPNRYEKPNWLNNHYHNISRIEHLELSERYNGRLYTPPTVVDPVVHNLLWLLDIVVDSRAEVTRNITIDGNVSFSFAPRFNQGNLSPLMTARPNVEGILSDILGKQVCFELSMRSERSFGRFRIVEKTTGAVVIPTFDSLSTGQMALFNLFTTIIRYADHNDLNKSIQLNSITGIVVVDEVELHLHSNLQRDILPKLIKKFPKVQFIITSHAPLFILGMEALFGSDGYELYQMPDGRKISAEMFAEFQKAYEYLSSTQKHQSEVTAAINAAKNKPLIVTEGKTDWMHLKAAYLYLKTGAEYHNLFIGMDIEFLEYDYDMGDARLCALCKDIAKVKRDNIVIFIADADKPETTKDLVCDNSSYKFHGGKTDSKTYSFILPVPLKRKQTPLISIEHYYSDETIKSEIECPDGIKRRLYTGGEFDNTGMGDGVRCGKKSCAKCGVDRIDIIDDEVYELKRDSKNIALSKKEFAEKMVARKPPFENEGFENFIEVFKTIKDILIAGDAINEQV